MYKKYIFKNVWHVLLFLLFGQPSIVVVRPALHAGRTLSLTVSFLIYFIFSIFFVTFFFFCRDGVFSFALRENRWPSLFFFFVFCFSTRTEWRRGCARPSSQALHPGSVYIHSKLYMLVFFFFFFQIKVHELYHVLCPFSNYCAKFYIRAA